MGMSSSIVGVKPTDEKWDKMLEIWKSCNELCIEVPVAVEEFFNWEDPTDMKGIEVNILSAVTEHQKDAADICDVDITKLPKDVTIIRFSNSY